MCRYICHSACVSASIEAGSGLGHEHLHTRPADVLLPNWVYSKPAALDFTVVSPLVQPLLLKRVPQQGQLPSQQKEAPRSALSSTGYVSQWLWSYMKLWGEEVQHTFSRLATRPAVKSSVPKPEALSSIYTRLNMMLVRANAKALQTELL